jgi:GT2 family glycosyltransferase
MKTVCLAILNHNGREHLEHLLPTALEAAREYSGQTRVVVVDNRSTKDDVAWVRDNFREVEVFVAPRNDYLFSYNDYAKECDCDVLVLLNNDIRIHSGFLDPLLTHMEAPDVFAVSATSYAWGTRDHTFGAFRLSQHHGSYYLEMKQDREQAAHTFFASGGFMAVDRAKYLDLGGFHALFRPIYSEDVDICFRAWHRGWRCIYEPRSCVEHREGATMGKVSGSRGARLTLRAHLLFEKARLPRAAWGLERLAYFIVSAWRRLRAGDPGWLQVHWSTYREWWRLKAVSGSPAATPDELARINASIEQPVEFHHSARS